MQQHHTASAWRRKEFRFCPGIPSLWYNVVFIGFKQELGQSVCLETISGVKTQTDSNSYGPRMCWLLCEWGLKVSFQAQAVTHSIHVLITTVHLSLACFAAQIPGQEQKYWSNDVNAWQYMQHRHIPYPEQSEWSQLANRQESKGWLTTRLLWHVPPLVSSLFIQHRQVMRKP